MITVDQVGEILGISRSTAYELAHSADFPHMYVGKRILVPRDRFFAWIDQKCEEQKMGSMR